MIRNYKVCMIGGGLSLGGQERSLVFLANALSNRGYVVTIICLFRTNIEFELNSDIRVVFPILNRTNSNKFIYALRLIFYIRKNVIKSKSKTVICFGDWFNAYSILAMSGIGIRKIITNRMSPNLYLGLIIEVLNKLLYRFSDIMIVQTYRAKEILKKKYRLNKIEIIPNAIEPFGINRENVKSRILSIGRLSIEKGHVDLIRAFASLTPTDWQLHIIGDGDERERLQDLVDNLNLSEKVIFHGKMKNIKELLLSSDIFVLPSFYEGFPNALLEAMGAGLCCVASDCVAGPAEIINDGISGRLFEPGDHIKLSEILKELIVDKKLRDTLAENAYKSLARYDKNEILNKFEKVLFEDEIISN